MSHFLVIFDRGSRRAADVRRVDDADEALMELFALEEELRREGDSRGVVMLVADSEEEIRRTHSHYFKDLDELLEAVS